MKKIKKISIWPLHAAQVPYTPCRLVNMTSASRRLSAALNGRSSGDSGALYTPHRPSTRRVEPKISTINRCINLTILRDITRDITRDNRLFSDDLACIKGPFRPLVHWEAIRGICGQQNWIRSVKRHCCSIWDVIRFAISSILIMIVVFVINMIVG